MNRGTRKAIDARIAQVLSEAKIYEPPIDLDLIAQHLNVPIHSEPLPKDISGFLHRDGTKALIVVNSKHSKARRRFTIAHELGHLIFDHKPDQVHVDKGFIIKFRADAKVSDPEETQANYSAATLLMPEPMLRKDLKQYERSGTIDDGLLLDLTERYGVSMQALIIRLNTLQFTLMLPPK
jgi:Zn-dependent peptidase ImmA (M78 family)